MSFWKFWLIPRFFRDIRREQWDQRNRLNGLQDDLRNSVEFLRNDIKDHKMHNHNCFLHLCNDLAALNKVLSSIEMELLMARGACLDNNFDGKQDL